MYGNAFQYTGDIRCMNFGRARASAAARAAKAVASAVDSGERGEAKVAKGTAKGAAATNSSI